MTHKLILVTDPGLDGAFAVALALLDPELEVLALAAIAGNVSADQATRNVQTLVEQMDPPRWPRIGAALPVEYEINATKLHGSNGLGGIDFPCAQLHHPHPSDKLIGEMVRQFPKEVTLVILGPATVAARAFDRDPEIVSLVRRIVVVGGARNEPGDAGPVSEFHFRCDPEAAHQVLRSGARVTLLPLDVTRKIVFSPGDLLNLPAPESRVATFLRRTVPFGISSTAGLFGTEGFYLQDVVGIAAIAIPEAFTASPACVDVETRGDLTLGMSVFDSRWSNTSKPNVELAATVDVPAVRKYINATLSQS